MVIHVSAKSERDGSNHHFLSFAFQSSYCLYFNHENALLEFLLSCQVIVINAKFDVNHCGLPNTEKSYHS